MLIEGEDCVRVLYSFILDETGDDVYLYIKRVLYYHYMDQNEKGNGWDSIVPHSRLSTVEPFSSLLRHPSAVVEIYNVMVLPARQMEGYGSSQP